MNYKKIAIIGGSFDPIHQGHIAMGKTILQQFDVDQVLYIPTIQNPLKKTTMTAYHDRCAMVKCALEEKMSLYEADFMYTIDLVNHLKNTYHFEKIYFVIGNDQITTLHQWKNIDELLKKITFVCMARDNQITSSEYPVISVAFDNHFESSTQVRNGDFTIIANNVKDYIFQHHLYIESIVEKAMSKKRYAHTSSVIKTALNIADTFKYSDTLKQKLYLAALFHDYCKEWDKTQMLQYMEKYFPTQLHLPIEVWHGFVASVVVKEKLGLNDELVLNAIKNHTIVQDETEFNLILKLADTIEPTRKFIPEQVKKWAYIDVFKAYALLKEIYKN